MLYYIDENTTSYELAHALADDHIDAIAFKQGSLIRDRDVAIWALEYPNTEFCLCDVSQDLRCSARVVLAAFNRDNDDIMHADSRYHDMSYNELYKAAMLEHLEDPCDDWSYDIKNKMYIDHGNCAIHMYDQRNGIWRQLDEFEIDALEDIVGRYYFVGQSRDGSYYNLRTGEIIG